MKLTTLSLFLIFIVTSANAQNEMPLSSGKSSTELQVRPFITDDARVVGKELAQLETWVRLDKESGQHWILGAYGPNSHLEITAGGVYGYQIDHHSKSNFSYALPLIQAKVLFKEYKPNQSPGVGVVIGTFLPAGYGAFKPAGYGTFGYLMVSQSFGEGDKLLLHANVGGNYLHINGDDKLINTWGFGTQINPYIPGTGTAFQGGYRYFISDMVQIDTTVGKGIAGATIMPFWFSAGIRIVTRRFVRRRNG
jgi:hypothetical protein